MGSNREKSNIAIAILEKLPFQRVPKIISHFDGSNNIFADCNVIKKIKGRTQKVYLKGREKLLLEY